MDIYSENVLDHYRHPRGKRTLPSPSVEHQEINLSCGDELTLQLQLKDGTIADLAWTGVGCAISQAGMSILSEELEGKTAAEALALTQQDVRDLLGVPVGPRRFKCALLCLHTLKNALRKAEGLPPQNWLDAVGLEEEDEQEAKSPFA